MADAAQNQELSQERMLTGVRRQAIGSTSYPVLGETILVEKIGEGTAGAVYEGRVPGEDRPVAVRVLRCQNEKSDRYAQFLAHSRAAQNVKSHHLVDIRETGAEPGLFYQVMEHVPSVSANGHLSALRDKLKPGVSEAEALEMAQAVATGLAALHAANVSHLNIHPGAILIPRDANGNLDFTRCKLGDHGLALHDHFARLLDGTAADNGTPGYMAPEQAQGSKNPGKTADVFAFGASLYAMLAGHAPFDGPSVPVILSVTCLQEVSDLRTWRPDVSRITARLVELCLRKGPSMRFPDGATLLKAVRICREAQNAPVSIQDAAIEEMQALIRQDEVKEQLLSRFFPPPPPDAEQADAVKEPAPPPATPATTHAMPSPVPPDVRMPSPAHVAPPAAPPRPIEEELLPPAVPANESAYGASIEVPPPPDWADDKTVPPPSHSQSMPALGEKRPGTRLFDELLHPGGAAPTLVQTANAQPVQEPPPPETIEEVETPAVTETVAVVEPSVPVNPDVAPANEPAPEAAPATVTYASMKVPEAPPEPEKPNITEDGEATMIGIPKLIDPAKASSAAQAIVAPDESAKEANADAAGADAPAVAVAPPPPPAEEWSDPTQPVTPEEVEQELALDNARQKGSWAPLVAALLMFGATTGVLWQKGYLAKWFGAPQVAASPATPPEKLDSVETGTPPQPPPDPVKAQTQEPASPPVDVAAKGPDPLKQSEEELKKVAEIRARAEEEARKLAEELRKKAVDEERRKQEEFQKQMKALAEEKERKRKEEETRLAAARVEQEAREAEERKKRAEQAAKELPKEAILDLGGNVALPFVLVPGGTFTMGTPKETALEFARASGVEAKEYLMESPPRPVKVEPFYISKTPVTVGQFKRFTETTGYKTAAERVGEAFVLKDRKWQRVKGASWRDPGFPQSDEHPAVLLSYRDCEAFLAWASRLSPQAMRVPTEAEWEYAARGSENRMYPWGNDWDGTRANHGDKQLGAAMGENGAGTDDGFAFTSPAGKFNNASWCGALDLAGNVLQWCSDVFEEYPKSNAPLLQLDAEDIPSDAKRVLRGGSFLVGPMDLRSAARRSSSPRAASVEFGLRLAFTPKH